MPSSLSAPVPLDSLCLSTSHSDLPLSIPTLPFMCEHHVTQAVLDMESVLKNIRKCVHTPFSGHTSLFFFLATDDCLQEEFSDSHLYKDHVSPPLLLKCSASV